MQEPNLPLRETTGRRGDGWRIAISLIASAACVGLLLRLVDWRQTVGALGKVDVRWIALASLLLIGCYAVFALRWWLLLGRDPALPVRRLFAVLMMGFAVNAVLPLRPGDALRAYLIGRVYGAGTSRALGSIVLERILDVATVLFIGGIAGLLVPLPPSMRRALGATAAMLAVAVAAVMALAAYSGRSTSFVEPTIGARRRWLDFVTRQFGGFTQSLRIGGSRGHLLPAIAVGSVGWAAYSAAMIACGTAFGIPFPVIGALLMTVATNLGGMVPSSPGSIGIYHALAVLALAVTGTPKDLALAVALVSHALIVMVQIMSGLLAFGTLGVAVRGAIKAKQWERPAEGA